MRLAHQNQFRGKRFTCRNTFTGIGANNFKCHITSLKAYEFMSYHTFMAAD